MMNWTDKQIKIPNSSLLHSATTKMVVSLNTEESILTE